VLNATNSTVTLSYVEIPTQARKNGGTLSHTKVAGLPAIEVQLPRQQVLGSSTQATHTDYYLWHEDYLYHLSTDAVDGDGAESALQSMLQSFTLTH
jgi:hypothetical protein